MIKVPRTTPRKPRRRKRTVPKESQTNNLGRGRVVRTSSRIFWTLPLLSEEVCWRGFSWRPPDSPVVATHFGVELIVGEGSVVFLLLLVLFCQFVRTVVDLLTTFWRGIKELCLIKEGWEADLGSDAAHCGLMQGEKEPNSTGCVNARHEPMNQNGKRNKGKRKNSKKFSVKREELIALQSDLKSKW